MLQVSSLTLGCRLSVTHKYSHGESVDSVTGVLGLQQCVSRLEQNLAILADRILMPQLEAERRSKYEQLVTELVHERDVTRSLVAHKAHSADDYEWLSQIRFYFRPQEPDVLKKLQLRISRASFYYGFEYLGVGERLVQTPLTDRTYLTLCEAMHMRLGGNPFGPAGTGKTETVKKNALIVLRSFLALPSLPYLFFLFLAVVYFVPQSMISDGACYGFVG